MRTELQEPSLQGSEKELLLGFLQYQQQVFLRKLETENGEEYLPEAALMKPLPPSTMTLRGMAAHLWFVEDYWREEVILGNGLPSPWAELDWQQDPDADWHSALEFSEILRGLKESMQATHRLLQTADWDQLSATADRDGNYYSLRWIAIHLLEEWARHLGHVDLVRENVDGATGD